MSGAGPLEWPMITWFGSTPPRSSRSSTSLPRRAVSAMWSVTAAPVSQAATAAASSTRTSSGWIGSDVPISPITPARTSLPSIPTISSATMCAASSSVVEAATCGGCAS